MRNKELELEDVSKVLLINLGGMGDLVLSTPALRAIRGRFPDARIDLVALPRSEDILRGLPHIDGIVIFPLQRLTFSSLLRSPGRVREMLSFLFGLRKKKYDVVVNFRTIESFLAGIKLWVMLSVIGARWRVGRNTEGRGDFFDRSVYEKDIGSIHEVDYALMLAKELDAEDDNRRLELPLSDDDHAAAERILKENGIDPSSDGPIVGVNPGAAWPSRRWPVGNFAAVADALARDYGCCIVVTGTKSEREIAALMEAAADTGITSLSGETTARELGALMTKFDLFITNDTGAMHLASAAGVDLIALFGPGDLDRYSPVQSGGSVTILHRNTDCAPCLHVDCPGDLKCLRAISTDDVIAAASQILNKKTSRRSAK